MEQLLQQEWPSLAIAALVVALAGLLIARHLRKGPSPEELEKRRRDDLHARGKLGDAEVVDVEGVSIIYSYSVAGVGYTVSQDIRAFESALPENTMSLIGPAQVKFDKKNPANSIVICEEWSGLIGRKPEKSA